MLDTLRTFVTSGTGPGALPLTSTLPDMKTDTESYVRLQRLYKEQARVENVCLFPFHCTHETQIGRAHV